MHWRETLNRLVYGCLLFACAGGLHAASTILGATNLGPVKSTDGGATWSVIPVNVNSGLLSGQPYFYTLAVDPKTPSTWYAEGGSAGPTYGFYKSNDSGQTWTGTPFVTFRPGLKPGGIVIDPVTTSTLYMIAVTGSNQLYIVKSTDSGATWTALKLPNTPIYPAASYPDGATPASIATDPKISGVVYALDGYDIFKSVDFGVTWTILSSGVDANVAVYRLDVDPGNSQVLYASNNAIFESSFCKGTPAGGECGLYKSIDAGKTWTQLGLPSPAAASLSIDPVSGAIYVGAVLTGSSGAVFKSTDGGTTWTPLKNGIGSLGPYVRVDPNNPSTVYAFDGNSPGTGTVYYRSTDSGATWTTVTIPNLCPVTTPKCGALTPPSFYDLIILPPPSSGTSGPPAISANGVVNGASFQPGIVANSWVTILGTNLAPKTDDWSNSVVNGKLPTLLDGVSVTMGGKPAYVYFISPGQINVLAPDVAPGPVSVTVTTASGTSAIFTATASQYGPAFFLWPGSQPVATRQDYSYAAKAGTFSGAATTPAKPGEVLILWATGLGPTIPAAPGGVAIPSDQTYSTASVPTVTINNLPATVFGAALAPGSVGLYQIAIQVPNTLADGDWAIQATIGGVQSPAGTVLTVRH